MNLLMATQPVGSRAELQQVFWLLAIPASVWAGSHWHTKSKLFALIVCSSANRTVAYFKSPKLGKVLKLDFCKEDDTLPCKASLMCPTDFFCAPGLKGSCFSLDRKRLFGQGLVISAIQIVTSGL